MFRPELELFTGGETIRFEALRSQLVQRAKAGKLIAIKAAVMGATAVFVGIVEYVAFKEIYDFIKAPLPGEQGVWSTPVLALTGTIVVIGFHLRATAAPESHPVRIMDRLVDVLMPVYVLGAGLMFAGILFFDGANGIFASASSLTLFGADAATERPLLSSLFEQHLAPLIAALFSLAAGSVVAIGVYVGHRCLSKVRDYIGDLFGRVRDAKEAIAAYKDIQDCQREYAELVGELNQVERARGARLIPTLVAEIAGRISDALLPFKRWVAEKRINPQPSPYAAEPDLDVDEVEMRIAAIDSITPEEITAALRGILTTETSHEDPSARVPFDDDNGGSHGGSQHAHTRH